MFTTHYQQASTTQPSDLYGTLDGNLTHKSLTKEIDINSNTSTNNLDMKEFHAPKSNNALANN